MDWKLVISTLTQKVSLISLLPFEQKSVHLIWNSCKPVMQKVTQMFILISLLPSKQMCHEGTVAVLWGATPPEIFLSPSLPPPLFRRVQNFEFRIYCLLKILANEKDVQGMNMILLDCYCILTYTKCCSSFLCLLALHVSNNL